MDLNDIFRIWFHAGDDYTNRSLARGWKKLLRTSQHTHSGAGEAPAAGRAQHLAVGVLGATLRAAAVRKLRVAIQAGVRFFNLCTKKPRQPKRAGNNQLGGERNHRISARSRLISPSQEQPEDANDQPFAYSTVGHCRDDELQAGVQGIADHDPHRRSLGSLWLVDRYQRWRAKYHR